MVVPTDSSDDARPPRQASAGASGARPSGGAAGPRRGGDSAVAGAGGASTGRAATGGSGRPAGGRAGALGGGAGRSGGGRSGGGRSGAGRPGAGPAGTGRGATREEIEKRAYDPRREERRKASRIALPDDVDPRMLDPEARKELRTLARETADLVARHLVVTGRLLDEDPEQALVHARAARAMAGRVGIVREAAGLAAYAAGEWAEALSELRAARRITGSPSHLAVFADCERALGRPERALAYLDDPDVARLTQDERVELVIVVSGARRDLGQAEAAVLTLQDPARRTTAKRPWATRLWYAFAEALLAAGRGDEARDWFAKAAEADDEGATDAGDRVLELDGFVLEDLADEVDGEATAGLPDAAELAELVKSIPVPQEPLGEQPGGDADDAAGPVEDAGEGATAALPSRGATGGSRPFSSEVAEPVAERAPADRAVLPPVFVEPQDEQDGTGSESEARSGGGAAGPDELRLFD